ncbi:Acyl-CoA N-acyltransferase [Akanthomyces lecanii RCEF 1005]|uniref:Acyl-CoA N-acyltransferase n=1 Tax=Akanthomyces lecanii RCEF 1005 TaxID=1081108 RepID=A0A162MZ17_CORDF|nr:Acyl-CoA N-acyltransferase [Akanthomyces lecanii RCEF 1005]
MAFRIRPATVKDADFIIGAFDSVIPVLIEAGNAGQWGTELFSDKDGFPDSTRDDLAQSEHFRTTGQGERMRTFVAEAHGSRARVAFITIREGHFSQHISSLGALKASVDEAESLPSGFSYIDVLIADQRVPQDQRRGAGAALIEHVKQHTREIGARDVYVDCWSGGDGKLVQYYHNVGFKSIVPLEFKKKDGSIWAGILMRMQLDGEQ